MARRDKEKTTALLTVAVCIILYLMLVITHTAPACLGVSSDSPLFHHVLYPFVHANPLHLLLNSWVLLSIVFYCQPSLTYIAISYIVAVLVPPFCLTTTPTVGLSSVIYCLFGVLTLRVKKRLSFFLWICLYIFIGFLLPSTNGRIHLYAYVSGLLISLLNTPLPLWRRAKRQ